ncbi:WNK protein kinase [Saprolegnia parasitica CBS 223.65]|uniref:WNK protein kinase n=1 Tax=Saprolegnia parasitica (strain CBS 223.65) TaxID=695850 RepID=A0A067C1A6_SAPPC|nr:WNK protein kinase [Saprolegnia parasitica CBS 223.65]KDO20336.1 WNK protein kinase [Saprolegnia parasitica CBS 223.65]|eukprot:XP_012208934.1 WNK protein kinase [Saprolegnia parasitica CBS 223.65]
MEDARPVETSPRGIYVRFDTKLGTGAYKTVYKGYDTDQGIDVAWNAIDIGALPHGEKARIIQEVELLKKLEHKNIINFYGSWYSKEKNQVVFITEIMTAGTLKSYIKRVRFVKWKIMKRWCHQILEGLSYLHSQSPPVIHRDLKCDNIFINGNTGDLRIGDLGLSTQMAVDKLRAQSVLGTPEFMAPELYDENYDEKVDIYAFGMCVLEMITQEVPYAECTNPAQIYKKVMAGVRPRALGRIKSPAARDFIELCLSRGNGAVDVTAAYLAAHPFLQPMADDDAVPECVDEQDALSPRHAAYTVVDDWDLDGAKANAKRRLSCPVLPQKTSGEDHDESKHPSLVFKYRTTIDTPLSSGVDAMDDHAETILKGMQGAEKNLDARKQVMDGRNNLLPNEKKLQPLPERPPLSVPLPSPETAPPAPSSAPTPLVLGQSPPPPQTFLGLRGSSGDFGSWPTTSSSSLAASPSKSPSMRKRGRRHEIKATKDLENDHSICLSLRIILDGKSKEIKFTFNLFIDSAFEVACELAAGVGILEPDIGDIADSINFLSTEAKMANLPEVDVDVWEEAPEPHSFSAKPLPHVSKMNLVAHSTEYVLVENGSSFVSMTSSSASSSQNPVSLSGDQALNVEDWTRAETETNYEHAIRAEQEKHEKELELFRKKMDDLKMKELAQQQKLKRDP